MIRVRNYNGSALSTLRCLRNLTKTSGPQSVESTSLQKTTCQANRYYSSIPFNSRNSSSALVLVPSKLSLHAFSSRRYSSFISTPPHFHARRYSSTPSTPSSTSTKLIEINSVEEFEKFVQEKGPRAFVSGFEDPYLNLALEAYIFKNMPSPAKVEPSSPKPKDSANSNGSDFQSQTDLSFEPEPESDYTNNRLLFYVNKACVVVGRNQNPWRECNVPLLKSLGIPLLRRRSGGGTVVHDGGNINFSVMTSREDFTRDRHAKMIVNAINELPPKVKKLLKNEHQEEGVDGDDGFAALGMGMMGGMGSAPHELGGIPTPFGDGIGNLEVSQSKKDSGLLVVVNGPQIKLAVNERYDIVDAESKEKVSGSAYKIERQKAYHHGTMLLDSRLDVLKALLHRDPERLGKVEGRGVESVKSPVVNLGIDKDVFISTVLDAFAKEYAPEKKTSLFDDLIPVDHLESEIAAKKESKDAVKYDAPEEFLNPLTAGIDYNIEDIQANSEQNIPSFQDLNNEIYGNTEKELPVVLVQPEVVPKEVYQSAKETMEWQWQFGQTPDFTHTLVYTENNPIGGVLASVSTDELIVKFKVSKGMLVGVELDPPVPEALIQFQFVKQMIGQKEGMAFNEDINTENTSKVKYIGKEIAGLVPNDDIAQWIGHSIDGTQLQ